MRTKQPSKSGKRVKKLESKGKNETRILIKGLKYVSIGEYQNKTKIDIRETVLRFGFNLHYIKAGHSCLLYSLTQSTLQSKGRFLIFRAYSVLLCYSLL